MYLFFFSANFPPFPSTAAVVCCYFSNCPVGGKRILIWSFNPNLQSSITVDDQTRHRPTLFFFLSSPGFALVDSGIYDNTTTDVVLNEAHRRALNLERENWPRNNGYDVITQETDQRTVWLTGEDHNKVLTRLKTEVSADAVISEDCR